MVRFSPSMLPFGVPLLDIPPLSSSLRFELGVARRACAGACLLCCPTAGSTVVIGILYCVCCSCPRSRLVVLSCWVARANRMFSSLLGCSQYKPPGPCVHGNSREIRPMTFSPMGINGPAHGFPWALMSLAMGSHGNPWLP